MTKNEFKSELIYFASEGFREGVYEDIHHAEQWKKIDPKASDLAMTIHNAELALHEYAKTRTER